MCSVTVVEWLWLPLLPVIVNVALVPEIPLRETVMVSVEVPGLLAGFGLNLALVCDGRPDTLRFTGALPFTAPMVTVYWPVDERFTFRTDGDAAMVKSPAAGLTVSDTVVE
jgi:hypothetical protein